MKKVILVSRNLIPLIIGLFFIYLSYQNTTVNDRNNVIKYIQNADYHFIIISIVFGLLSHISRAIRWTYLLVPLGYKPRISNSVLAVLIGYLSNLGIPRSGELLRATVMNRYDKIPFQKGFGTLVISLLCGMPKLFLYLFRLLFGGSGGSGGFLGGRGFWPQNPTLKDGFIKTS